MTEFFQSIKSDLLSRRLLPFVALAVVGLVVAVAYVAAGSSGGGGGAKTLANTPSVPPATGVLAVAVAPANPNQAVSETPAGARYQSQGPTRNPFTPLPAPAAKSASTSGSSSSSGSSSKSSTGGSTPGAPSKGGSPGSPPPTPAKPSKPAKPGFPYVVSVLFGRLPATSGQQVTLTPYENLKPRQPLPSKKDARIAFERVTSDGKGAVFKLAVPPILRGTGTCLPSASECETIDVEVGHAEELEYIEASGNVAIYELKTVSIAKTSAVAARAKASAKVAVAKTRKP